MFFLASCAKEPSTGHKRLPPQATEKPPEVIPPPPPPQSAAPRYKASQQLVTRGIAALDAGNTIQATQLFQEAINIDANNGMAYFYLAKATLESGQAQAASGFLDKAEALIGSDPSWAEEITALRDEIAGEGVTE